MALVLIIDDDPLICRMLGDLVENIGHDACHAQTLESGMDTARETIPDVVFLDVGMPDGSGLDIISDIKDLPGTPEVIIITGAGDMDGAELAIKNGAWDYLLKPLVPKELILPLRRVLQYRDSLSQSRPRITLLDRLSIVGESAVIRASLKDLARAATSEAGVLITGETGTGKELFARVLHQNSPRNQAPFVILDCAALPQTLVNSHLFGHEKGAFTGADKKRQGLVSKADKGTLFLDEVGELPLDLQAHFLRVLQERRFRPVGGRETTSDFRLVAATNRDLDQMVAQGKFRQDLLYRIRSMAIEAPPLRKRKEDIQALALAHIKQIFDRDQHEPKGFSQDFFQVLTRYDWPGNVRELIHSIDAAVAQAREDAILFPKHLPHRIRIEAARSVFKERESMSLPSQGPDALTARTGDALSGPLPAYKAFREAEQEKADKIYFNRLMMEARGNLRKASSISGLGRTRLYTLLKKYGISKNHWKI